MLLSRFVVWTFSVGLIVSGAGVASGQDYPSKPIHIVTLSAGGGTDFMARLVVQGIGNSLGQPLVVDNKGGGFIAAEFVSKAPPDGYTVIINGSSHWRTPLLQKTPFDAVKDFSPISLLVRESSIVVIHPSVPAKSIKELVAVAKARPGQLNYGSTQIGASAHLAAELLKAMGGVEIVNVSYKGTGQAVTGVISGEVQMTIFEAGIVMPHVKAGKLRALAVTSADRSALNPELPTVSESGLPGYEAVSMTAFLAPAKTPTAIINRLHQAAVRAINQPDIKAKFMGAGVEVVGSSAEQLAATVNTDVAKWAKVIKQAGIKVD